MKRLLLALMTITSVGLQSANADGGVAVRIGGVGFQIWDRDRDHRGHGHDHRPVFRPRPVVVQPVPVPVPVQVPVPPPPPVPGAGYGYEPGRYVQPEYRPVQPEYRYEANYYAPVKVKYKGRCPGPTRPYVVRHPYTGRQFAVEIPAYEIRKCNHDRDEIELEFRRGECEIRFHKDGCATVEYDF